MSRKELAEGYMTLGGIPYYWRYLDKRYSLAQNIDRMFFAEGAPLVNEFRELYASLFGSATQHVAVIEAFRAVTKTRKSIHLTFVTSSGLAHTEHAQAVQSEVTLDDLFQP